MHALARELGASRAAAVLAGLAWAFWPYRISHLIHLQLQALYFLPLVLLALHRTMARGRRRDAMWLGVLTGLQTLSSLYYGVMAAIAIAVGVVGLGIGTGRLRSTRLLSRLALAASSAFWWSRPSSGRTGGCSVTKGSRATCTRRAGTRPSPGATRRCRTRTGCTAARDLLTARDARRPRAPWHASRASSRALFPGIVLTAARGRRLCLDPTTGHVAGCVDDGGARRSLRGPVARTGRRSARVRGVPRVRLRLPGGACAGALRCPRHAWHSRFLPRSAPPALQRVPSIGSWAVRIALVAIAVEYASMPWPLVERPPRKTGGGAVAGRRGPDEGAVLYLPLTNDRRNTIAMVDSLQHGRPIVNGYSGQRPSFFPALVDMLSTFPSADALWTLRDFGVRFVVSPSALSGDRHRRDAGPRRDRHRRDAAGRAGAAFAEARHLRAGLVRRTSRRGWRRRRRAPPPPPGPAPFAAPESLQYTVKWVGGPLDLCRGPRHARGRNGARPATCRIASSRPPRPRRGWRGSSRHGIASRPTPDRDLLPRTHRRALREGRRSRRSRVHLRRADRRRPHRRTRSIRGAGRLSNSSRHARRADGAVLHPHTAARHRRYDRGAGQRRRAEPDRAGKSRAPRSNHRPGPQPRGDPSGAGMVERVPRREPIQSVVWISTDAKRVVVAADIAAGFGRLRLELAR